MKKIIAFALCAIVLMSCGGYGQLPTDNITFGQAFKHVANSGSYWVFIIIAAIIAIVGGFFIKTKYQAGTIDGGKATLAALLLIALNLCVWLIRPSEVAANTTVEQAARGVFIGY